MQVCKRGCQLEKIYVVIKGSRQQQNAKNAMIQWEFKAHTHEFN